MNELLFLYYFIGFGTASLSSTPFCFFLLSFPGSWHRRRSDLKALVQKDEKTGSYLGAWRRHMQERLAADGWGAGSDAMCTACGSPVEGNSIWRKATNSGPLRDSRNRTHGPLK